MNLFRTLIAGLLPLLLLSGCIDYDEEMWLNSDLSGHATMTISVPEELVKGNTGLERDMSEDNVRGDVERIPGVKLESFNSLRDAGKVIVKLALTFDSVEKLTRHEKNIADSTALSLLGEISVDEQRSKRVLRRVIAILPETRSKGWGQDLVMKGLGSFFLSNNYLTYKLHIPGELVTANTQRIDGVNHTVEWKYTVAQALREAPDMQVEWKKPFPAWLVFAIIGALALLGFVVYRRRHLTKPV